MSSQYPLCVDLDGTLIHTDLLFESFIRLIKQHFFSLFLIPFWLLKGKSYLKHEIARRIKLDYELLPYNDEVISFLKKEKSLGRKIVLVTASDQLFADRVAAYLGIFDEVYGSNANFNLKGRNKAKKLVELYGEEKFSYIGNDKSDIHIWQYADSAIVVGDKQFLTGMIDKSVKVLTDTGINNPKSRSFTKGIIKEIRPHQWVKNILIFIPLMLAHAYFDQQRIFSSLIAFISFCLCASSVYMFNDLMDLDADRIHPTKRNRPFASGELPIVVGLFIAPLLLLASILLSMAVSLEYTAVFSVYFILTTAYSLGLKSFALLDVFILAGLYTIRVLAGTVAANVDLSFWLLAFSLFFFFSLALLKRFSELFNLVKMEQAHSHGRGYSTDDISILSALGVSSGFISVLVIALYIQTPEHVVQYQQPELLWMVFPAMLYWISRMWLLAHRGEMNEDPVLFAVKDKQSYMIVIMAIAGIALAV
ncbi:MAG: UbiA family prenyltransferase [Gammaproteobacteria bacterium]|nr:UbiA family prenyltransferase [Gammaproteobacteria bacterium]